MPTKSTDDVARQQIRQGLLDTALKLGEGIDSSGKPMAWTLDCREVLLSARYLRPTANLLWRLIKPYAPDVVGGPTMSADPLVAALLCEADNDGQPLKAFSLRKEPKAYGLRKRFEGPAIEPGNRVVLVDDLVSSGSTVRRTLEALSPMRVNVVGVAVMIDFRHPSMASWLETNPIPVEAIFTLAELGLAPLPPSGRAQATLRWTWEPLNGRPYAAPHSSPCIAEGSIFVGSDQGFLLSLSLDGRERWRQQLNESGTAINSSPMVSRGRVYFGADDGRAYCLDADSGKELWAVRCGGSIRSSAALDSDREHVVIGTKHGDGGGALVALSADSGKIVWQFDTGHFVNSSPCYDPRLLQVVVGSNDGAVYAVDAQHGRLRWRFQTGADVKGAVVSDGEEHYFFGSYDGYLYALEAASGALTWRKKLAGWLYPHPLIFGDIVVVGGQGHVVALERSRGSIRWIAPVGGQVVGGAASISQSMIAVGSGHGAVYLLDGLSGALCWQYQTGGPIAATPGVCSDLFVIPSHDGKLYGFSLAAVGD